MSRVVLFSFNGSAVIPDIVSVFLSSVINLPCISCWAIFGTFIRNFLKNTVAKKTVEWLMAILLVLTAATILLG